ncbi:hypothetical protein SAMN04487970_10121, partial [Paenibacillus tianmuensis]
MLTRENHYQKLLRILQATMVLYPQFAPYVNAGSIELTGNEKRVVKEESVYDSLEKYHYPVYNPNISYQLNKIKLSGLSGPPLALPSGGMIYTTWDPTGQRFVNNDADAGMYFSDADPLTYSIVRQPQGFSVSIVSGSLVHLSGNPTRTNDSFTVRATDPNGLYADLTEVLNFAPQSLSSHNL